MLAKQPKQIILPSHVLAVESLRKAPFSRMLGCVESESVAMRVASWLAEHGDSWRTEIVAGWDQFGTEWYLSHDHPDGTRCRFVATFTEGHCVNPLFVMLVTRRGDGEQFRDDVLRQLIPEWPLSEDEREEESPCA